MCSTCIRSVEFRQLNDRSFDARVACSVQLTILGVLRWVPRDQLDLRLSNGASLYRPRESVSGEYHRSPAHRVRLLSRGGSDIHEIASFTVSTREAPSTVMLHRRGEPPWLRGAAGLQLGESTSVALAW
eukprot:CAMPEP_0174745272 /NCGR_PEP_ID=MMETSP1094-20130205/86409_1 /TAXON_ID=156173 /ORGANISM="Chrysochromulina brevifilum, Strain UTEX LB 985" /LENGTH=128 /DNA_ID=CAMNT_0015949803 /DNA_START=177 /DNA_END=560 /DNA_ORIENTATION=-